MIQLVPNESGDTAEYYDRCLEAVRCILMDDQDEAVNYRAVTRISKYVLFPIYDYYPIIGGSDFETEKSEETATILKAKMQYYTAYLIETHDTGLQVQFVPSQTQFGSILSQTRNFDDEDRGLRLGNL